MARSVSSVAVASRLGGGVLSHFQYTPCIVISSSTGYSNPRSPGYGGARCNWRHATRPMPPSRNSERRSFASRSSGWQISSFVMPRPELAGVSVGPRVARPYFVEIWPEKTTVNDVLMPLAYQDGLNIIPASGETSALRCRELVDRAIAAERPIRVLYVSDFDPAGMGMPVSMARKVEHEIDRRGADVEIQVRPIVLTHDQCVEYRLPRAPIKETEKRGARFEKRFGEGATELDALEALHPGELRRILEREIGRYLEPEPRWPGQRCLERFSSLLRETRR